MNNKTNNNFKFLQINKNNSDITNKIDQINDILTEHKPDFMIINELQKQKNDTTSKYQFPGFIMDGWLRTAILIKSDIKYKRRKDLETKGIASVWIQVGLPGMKQFLVQSVYRQFKRQGLKGSHTHSSQIQRWNQILDKWQKANQEDREVITLGDINVDSLIWETPQELLSPQDKQRMTFYTPLRDKILVGGTTKINSEYTRHDNQPNRRFSCLDHCYTNNPLKVNSHTTHHSTFSDHSMLEINKMVKKNLL